MSAHSGDSQSRNLRLIGRRHVGEPSNVGEPSIGECVVRRGVEIQASRCSGLVRPTRVGIVCATASCAASCWPRQAQRIPRGRSGSPSLAHGRTPPVACSRARRRCGTSRHATCGTSNSSSVKSPRHNSVGQGNLTGISSLLLTLGPTRRQESELRFCAPCARDPPPCAQFACSSRLRDVAHASYAVHRLQAL
jgi:hypothetical protein